MDKGRKIIFCFTLISLLIISSCSNVDAIGQQFKQISIPIAKEFASTAKPSGQEAEMSNKDAERQIILLEETREKLKVFVDNNPDSLWADDAQFLLASLSVGSPKQEAFEYEYLLREYPDMLLEDWTMNTLVFLAPSEGVPVDLLARLALAINYLQAGEISKLQRLCDESITKYPDRADRFEYLLKIQQSMEDSN